MKYYLAKVVRGVTYYFNVEKVRWEGLKDNATEFNGESELRVFMDRYRFVGVEIIPV